MLIRKLKTLIDKFAVRAAIILVLIIITAGMMPAVSVSGSGSGDGTLTATDAWDLSWLNDDWKTWPAGSVQADATTIDNGGVGWQERASPQNNWIIRWYAVGFDVSAIQALYNAGADITDIHLKIGVTSKTVDYDWQQYFSVYKGEPLDPAVLVQDDAARWYNPGPVKRISPDIYEESELTVGDYTVDFDIQDVETGLMDYVLDDPDGKVTFYIMTTNQALLSEPVYAGSAKASVVTFAACDNGVSDPQLYYEYVEGTPARVVVTDTNDPVDADTDGTEVTDNITWQSPRAAYADEDLYWKINGDSGADISLELVDADGNIWDSVDDSIRTDGNYDYVVDLPDSFYGFVRVLEKNDNVRSLWGYVMPSPDSDQVSNTVYAINTEHPQYNFAFSRYLTYTNDAFVLHWKTNVQSDELGDHNLWLFSNGLDDTLALDKTLEWLNENYYMANDDNAFLDGWRYMILTPYIQGSGFEDYDGMIYNIDYKYSTTRAGFIQAQIIDNSDNSTLADSHSCYWYLPYENDGLVMSLNKSVYAKTEEMRLDLWVGEVCQAKTYLDYLVVQIIDDTGAVVSTSAESYVEGANEIALAAPNQAGSYEVRLTFSGDGTWDYIHDIPFSVKGTVAPVGGESLVDKINTWIKNTGLDNPAGYWLMLIVGMVVLFLICYKSPVMRVAMPLLLLGAFIVWQFVDYWIIVVLGLGAGITLYGIFRKRTGGSGGGDG